MIIERTKNAKRNIMIGISLRIYTLAMPFIIRTAIIYKLGAMYVGLSSLFSSILQVLNMAELGIGAAMVYSMYEPIALDDKEKICSLLCLYKKMYKGVGWVVCVIGLGLLPVLNLLIEGDVPPDINYYFLYIIYLFSSVFSYWFLAYKNCLFQAHQRVDKTYFSAIISNTFMYIFQLVAILRFNNYYIFAIAYLLSQLINNVIVWFMANKYYPQYIPVGELSQEDVGKIRIRIRDLVTSKIGGTILLSADTVVISAFLGLEVLAIYQNYFYIVTAITSCLEIVFTSVIAGIGNSVLVENEEKNYKDINKFLLLICWGSCLICGCLLCCMQKVIYLWVGSKYILPNKIVILFVVYLFFFEMNRLFNVYKDAAGIWSVDKYRPLFTSLINLFLNLVMVKRLGLYGILLSTIIATVAVGIPWNVINLNKTVFRGIINNSIYANIWKYSMISFIIISFIYLGSDWIGTGSICTISFETLAVFVITNSIYILVFRKTEAFKDSIGYLHRLMKGEKGC